MQRFVFLLALLLSIAVGPGLAQGGGGQAEQQLAKLVRDLSVATIRKDMAFLDGALAADHVNVYRHGPAVNKQQWLDDVRNGKTEFSSLREREVKIRVYGDTAVAQYLIDLKGKLQDRPVDVTSRAIRVFVKQDGRWRCVATQYTPVERP